MAGFRNIVSTGGGGIPAGAAVMTDAVSFFADLSAADSNAALTDVATFDIGLTQSETNAVATDAATFGFSGYADSNAGHAETRATLLTRWATTNSTAGTAPVNPTNAQGEGNGTTATVKAGGLANGTSTLNLNIVATLAGVTAGSSPPLLSYYSIAAGVADTFTITASYRQQGSGSNTTLTLPNAGNFLTTPQNTTLTNIDPTVTVTVTFTHAAVIPATGGQINVDAVGIQSSGVL